MYIDLSDSIRFALRNSVPSGIQRVAFSVAKVTGKADPITIDWKNGRIKKPIDKNILTWDFIKALGNIKNCDDYDDFMEIYHNHFNDIEVRSVENKHFLFIGGAWNFNTSQFLINTLAEKNRVSIFVHDFLPFEDKVTLSHSLGFCDFFNGLSKKIDFYTSTEDTAILIDKHLSRDVKAVVPFPLDTNLFVGHCSFNSGMNNLEKDHYYLSIGAIDGRKRHDLVVRSWIESGLYQKFKLFIVGPKILNDKRFEDSLSLGHKNIDYLGLVDDLMYYRLILSTRGVFYPSPSEGFGMPLLDSYLHNKPCFVPKNSSYTKYHMSWYELDFESGFSEKEIIHPSITHLEDKKFCYSLDWLDFINKFY